MPEKYYLDYFNYVLDFVERQYSHILDEIEYSFYQSFRDLTEDAQCLYIRFSNRRGNFFRWSKISYPEIQDSEAAKKELLHQDFISINESSDTIQFQLFTKEELVHGFDFLSRKSRKWELLEELSELDIPKIHSAEEIVEVKKNDEVNFIKLLFFGNNEGQMTDFVVRDVGNVKIQPLDESKFSPWFQSREEALGVMHIIQLNKMVKEMIAAEIPLEHYLKEMPWKHWLKYPQSAKSAEKLLLKVAYHLERSDKADEALTYYRYAKKHPAKEREIRLLEKLGDQEKAIQVAQAIMENPENASELTFATDYLNRSGIRIDRSMTRRLKNAPSIEIQKMEEERVEKAVISHFEKKGWNAIHAENFIWRGLFGLIFWNEIFDETYGSFHHPLQRQPSDLNDSVFFESRREVLQKKLDQFRSKRALFKRIEEMYSEKEGMANRFVTWHESLLPYLETMVAMLPLKGMKSVLMEMSKNMKENSAGFPDLFIWKDSSYHFYEIKSPNDHLSAQQLFWLDFLASAKIKADVLRVSYQN